MIEFLHVQKVYENGYPALRDISLHIDKGEFVFLTGESGAGKTTLLKHIFMDLFPDQGHVSVAGMTSGGSSRHMPSRRQVQLLRRKIGIVFQDIRLLHDRSVLENITFAARIGRSRERAVRKKSYDVLARVGLSHKCGNYPHQLSGGEQQRVAIARALVNDPRIFIADEPTGNLDYRISREIFALLQDIHNNGTTVVMATHERSFIETTHYREIVLHDGLLRSGGEGRRFQCSVPLMGG
ncbi:cell division ATP-binding protein FtsE [Chitinivibrio alkaliphilus]|uniref:Cell division ATP-binding protein FtsE n=1 Tax=Chitinivibrio alkaliphilus ACht1 TaxID=1313304 RepID=U7D7J3_9BACT|nr:ATP-binding cassette domain-containing protein [Chitinivibrio alkaliphilus]ERP38925.1 cell division ATP-binding protein FtsE [Chitinivibrio alkaliphilus ACht1]